MSAARLELTPRVSSSAELGPARVFRLSVSSGEQVTATRQTFLRKDACAAFSHPAPGAMGASVDFGREEAALTCRVTFPSAVCWYGAGLVAGPLARNGRKLLFLNADRWPYDDRTEGLYQCHPYLLALRQDGKAVGVLADCAARGEAEVTDHTAQFAFDTHALDLYLVEGDGPEDVQRTLCRLLPRAPLPPRFALGYHQCRWSYESEAQVMRVAHELRARELPCDAIWLDIGHMSDCRTLTWDAQRFPEPAQMIERLHAQGLRLVAIHNPGILACESNALFRAARDHVDWVCNQRGEPMSGRVWPGLCWFPDFRTQRTRDFWAEQVARWLRSGVDGVWNDMNEPSVFDGSRMLSELGDLESDFQNTYGFHMCRATHEGLRRARPEQRPFVLSRSNTLGGSAHAAAWTGDNRATWDDLRWSIPMALNAGLCGQPLSGSDVGGFDGTPDAELFVRWFQVGVFLPFFRGHSDKDSAAKEPWALGPQAEALVRQALALRMQLVHVLYTLFREAERTGMPVVRPLFFADPSDEALRRLDDALLLGSHVLVAPVVHEGARSRAVTLPRGDWYHFPEGKLARGRTLRVAAALDQVPLFVRAGHVLVLSQGGMNTEQAAAADLSLHVFLDARGEAQGSWFEDSGDGFAYREGGAREVTLHAKLRKDSLSMQVHVTGTYVPRARRVDLFVYHPETGRCASVRLAEAELAGAISLSEQHAVVA